MIILVTGASHTGKTALAQKLLERYRYPVLSLDLLKMGLIRSGQTSLTPENDEETGPRLRTQGNMIEWAFVCLTDKLEELKGNPAPERHDELTHWLATLDCTSDDAMRDARTAGRLLSNGEKTPPRA